MSRTLWRPCCKTYRRFRHKRKEVYQLFAGRPHGRRWKIRTLAPVLSRPTAFRVRTLQPPAGVHLQIYVISSPDLPTNSAGGNREEHKDRTSNIIQFELGWNPHGSKGFSRLALRIGNLISNHYSGLDDDGKSGTIAVTTEPQNAPLKVAVRWLFS